MDDAGVVRECERLGHGLCYARGSIDWKRRLPPDDLRQRFPRHELHHQERARPRGSDVVDRDDPGVGQGGDGASLSAEARHGPAVLGQTLPEELHRHHPAKHPVLRRVHLGHAALP